MDEGITQGCDTERYCPAEAVTRAQMAPLLVRALDLPATDEDYFDDDNAHEGSINAAAGAGLVRGCDERIYCPRSGRSGRRWRRIWPRRWSWSPTLNPSAPSRPRSGRVVTSSPTWTSSETYADRSLTAYRHYVINHEFGHWLELEHRECEYEGASAWVMQQQSISLDGCESRVWPHVDEKDEARANLNIG